MRFVELFAGIGGFSLGLERAGMICVGHVEIEPYPRKILLKHWPDVPLLEDVRNVKGDEFGQVDVLCGGFPCQDLSIAGKQKGITGERSGLFDEIIRIAGVCRPKYIVLENVANLLNRPDWFGYVLARIAEIGYDAEWQIIPASWFGKPHRRKGCLLLPTPAASDWKNFQNSAKKLKKYLNSGHQVHLPHVLQLKGFTDSEILKLTEEWMGFPTGHTELDVSETQLSHKSPNTLEEKL